MELLKPFLDTFSKILKKKPPSKLKMPRSCIAYSHLWPKYLVFILFFPSSRSWYVEQWPIFNYTHFEIYSQTSCAKNVFILPSLESYNWDYSSSKITIYKLENYSSRTYQKAGKMWRAYYTIKAYPISLKSSDLNWLVTITMTYWLAISELIKSESWWPKNISSLPFVKMLRPMWEAAMSAWLQK